jgi:four helix bundle protein
MTQARPHDHSRLRIYQRVLDWYARVLPLAAEIPKGTGDIADQLRRGGLSVVLNLAEGAGEFAPREKARFYRFSRRSATECSAILAVVETARWGDPAEVTWLQSEVVEFVAILTTMAKRRMTDASAGKCYACGAALRVERKG